MLRIKNQPCCRQTHLESGAIDPPSLPAKHRHTAWLCPLLFLLLHQPRRQLVLLLG